MLNNRLANKLISEYRTKQTNLFIKPILKMLLIIQWKKKKLKNVVLIIFKYKLLSAYTTNFIHLIYSSFSCSKFVSVIVWNDFFFCCKTVTVSVWVEWRMPIVRCHGCYTPFNVEIFKIRFVSMICTLSCNFE